jgi:hypothetical protein
MEGERWRENERKREEKRQKETKRDRQGGRGGKRREHEKVAPPTEPCRFVSANMYSEKESLVNTLNRPSKSMASSDLNI